MKRVVIAIGLILCGVVAYGQEDTLQTVDTTEVCPDTFVPIKPKYVLKDVVVTATRIPAKIFTIPASITSITREEIEDYDELSKLMELTPDAVINKTGFLGSLKSLSLRGSTYQQTLFLLNGRELNDPQNGGLDLNLIPLNAIDKIEIVRGGASSLYGANAFGGVVNIITKSFYENKPYAKVSVKNGSYNTNITEVEFGRGIGENLDFYLTWNMKKTDGHRANSSSDSKNLFGKIRYRLGGLSFNVQAKRYENKLGLPGSLQWSTPSAKENDYRLDTDFEIKMKDLKLKIFHSEIKNEYEDPDWNIRSSHHNVYYGGEFVNSSTYNSHTLIYGVCAKKNSITSTEVKDRKSHLFGGFVQEHWRFIEGGNLYLCCRYDTHSVYGGQISPSAGLGYILKNFVNVYANIKKSFRAPTFNDLFFNDPWMKGDSTLKPEVAVSYEFGMKNRIGEKFSFEASYFEREVEDMILWGDSDGDWIWGPYNIDAKVSGIETSLSFSPIPGITLRGDYSYIDSYDNASKKKTIYQPMHTASTSLKIAKKFRNKFEISFKTDSKYTGEKFTNEDNSEKLPDYILFDASLKLRIVDISLFYKIKNLSNISYECTKYYSMPGRNILFGISWEFWN